MVENSRATQLVIGGGGGGITPLTMALAACPWQPVSYVWYTVIVVLALTTMHSLASQPLFFW